MSYNRDMPTGNCQKCINTFGTLGCCDTISNEWRYDCDDGMRYFDERKPQTNADRIRSMTDEELAEKFNQVETIGRFNGPMGKTYWQEWLGKEVAE